MGQEEEVTMPYTMMWYQERRVALATIDNVTLQEVRNINEEVLWYLEAGVGPVHLVIDISRTKKHPTNVLQLKQSLSFMKHPHLGYMVVVGASAMASSLATILLQLFGVNYRMFNHLNDGLSFLHQQHILLADGVRED